MISNNYRKSISSTNIKKTRDGLAHLAKKINLMNNFEYQIFSTHVNFTLYCFLRSVNKVGGVLSILLKPPTYSVISGLVPAIERGGVLEQQYCL